MACEDIGINMKTYRRWNVRVEDFRKGPLISPQNKLTEGEKKLIISISTSSKYMDLSPSQIVPSLADTGIYIASESSFFRVLKEAKMLEHRGHSKPKNFKKPKVLTATGPNMVYSWDITYLPTVIAGKFNYLYMFMDVFSRKIVGWQVHEKECSTYASILIEKICNDENLTELQRALLYLHSDNGAPMKGATMLATLQRLGIIPSFSRPHVSDDNAFSESLFKTLKYCPSYPYRPFGSIDSAKTWVSEFVEWYNYKHLHSGIKFVTPNDKHLGNDEKILSDRKEVYNNARKLNPSRWSGSTRNWSIVKEVHLNNLKVIENEGTKLAA
jgi:transposase InsO family protein